MTKASDECVKSHCNVCGHETKHKVIANHTQHGSEPCGPDYEVTWTNIFELLECSGCEDVSVRKRGYFSEWDEDDVEIRYYPPRIARQLPAWKNELPAEVTILLEEVYVALQADSRILAMMGARALIDLVILREVGDVGSFPKKLSALEQKGVLSRNHREVLEAALEVGNAASHRGHRPQPKHVAAVMDIVENLLQTTVLQSVVKELRKATPKRRSPNTRSTGKSTKMTGAEKVDGRNL